MTNHTTDWSMRVFASSKKINYPQYILKAIGKATDNKDDANE